MSADRIRTLRTILILLTAAAAAQLPLWRAGFFAGTDWFFEFARVAEFERSIRAGIWPVRWSDAYGAYGSPVFIFMPPLFLAIASSAAALSGSLLAGVKAAVAVLAFAGCSGMYLFCRRFFGRLSSLAGACIYALSPYALMNVYLRNAFSEFTAQCLAPLVLYALDRVLCVDQRGRAPRALLIAAGALFLLAHNLSILMYLPVFIVYTLARLEKGRWAAQIRGAAGCAAAAFGLASFYLLPALIDAAHLDTEAFRQGKFSATDNFIGLPGLFFGPQAILSPITALFWGFCAVVLIRWSKRLPSPARRVSALFFALLAASLLMITPQSLFIWTLPGPLCYLQFPWRFLSPAGLAGAFLSAAAFDCLFALDARTGSRYRFQLTLIAALFILTPLSYFFSGRYTEIHNGAFEPAPLKRQLKGQMAALLYLPRGLAAPIPPSGNGRVAEFTGGGGSARVLREGPADMEFEIRSPRPGALTLNTAYFPGWRGYRDGVPVSVGRSASGLLRAELPKGDYRFTIRFEETRVRCFAVWVTVLTAAAIGLLSAMRLTRPFAGYRR